MLSVPSISWALKDVIIQLCVKRGTVVDIAASHQTYDPRISPHIYLDEVGLLLLAAIESDGARNEVGASIVVEANGGQSVSFR